MRTVTSETKKPVLSISVNLYKSEQNIPSLLEALDIFARENKKEFDLEGVFVVDGSPDHSYLVMKESLPKLASFRSQLHNLSKNFGATYAMRCALANSTGDYFCNIGSDLQDPLEAVKRAFDEIHTNDLDVVFGQRVTREDPLGSRIFSMVFWTIYRRFIEPAVPKGGVDLFMCNRRVIDEAVRLKEQNGFFIGLLFWMGFRRGFVPYKRVKRAIGKSSWSFSKKMHYLLDSLYSFSDLPIKVVTTIGGVGLAISILFGLSILIGKLSGRIAVPGYAATFTVILFFGGLNSLALGIVGEYVYRALENTKGRPLSIVLESHRFNYQGASKEEARA